MKYFGWILTLSFVFIFIFSSVAFGQCQSPFIDCNGICTLPNECTSGGTTGPGTGGTTGPGTGGTTGGGSGSITNPIQSGTFGQLMAKIAKVAAQIGLPIVVVFIIYSGFLFVSARGNEEQLTKAKSTFFWTIIGALLVVGAFAIATAIENFAKQL